MMKITTLFKKTLGTKWVKHKTVIEPVLKS